ncbi:MAG: hypothetical protein U9N04_04785 [Patescibacteria group bacterium]|nr:hypothetical protein [Patescibacteria group bacterium]
MKKIDGIAYGRINKFLRSDGRRGKEFTIQKIVKDTGFSSQRVRLTIEAILKNEKLFAGGPSVVKGERGYRCRTKYLDDFRII